MDAKGGKLYLLYHSFSEEESSYSMSSFVIKDFCFFVFLIIIIAIFDSSCLPQNHPLDHLSPLLLIYSQKFITICLLKGFMFVLLSSYLDMFKYSIIFEQLIHLPTKFHHVYFKQSSFKRQLNEALILTDKLFLP